jgi:NADH-quinone oxidoreductase subunit A
MVAILFIVFDVETVFLLPWAVSLRPLGWSGFASAMIFIFILTVGLVYEWKKGALEWD